MANLPATETLEVDEKVFQLHKRIGQYAIMVYEASVAPTKLIQAAAFGINEVPFPHPT